MVEAGEGDGEAMMRVENVRLGHATSSSSSHSIVFTTEPARAVEPNTWEDNGWHYEWDNFCLTDLPSKMRYLAVQVYRAIRYPLGHAVAATVVRDLTGIDVPEHSSIDHESAWCIPTSRDGWMPDRDFVGALQSMLADETVVVCGGNDNEDCSRPPGNDVEFPMGEHGGKTVLRRNGDVWTLYNARSGTKVSMVVDDLCRVEPTHEVPDLIDLKITDRCHKGCPWCYQDSTPAGTESSLYGVRKALCDLGAFEVVIGGGEPTTHPGLYDLINGLHEDGMAVSLTTGTLDWQHNPALVMAFRTQLRALAFSVQEAGQVDEFAATCRLAGVSGGGTKLWIHVIPDVAGYDLRPILDRAAHHGVRALLLGFKTTGRAGEPPRRYSGTWINDVKREIGDAKKSGDCLCVAVDTMLAHDHAAALEAAGVSPLLYRTREGIESAYYDAVTEKFGPSSYEPEKMVQLDTGYGKDPVAQMRAAWEGWQKEAAVAKEPTK